MQTTAIRATSRAYSTSDAARSPVNRRGAGPRARPAGKLRGSPLAYQVPPVGQPPLLAVVHVRLIEPSAALVIVKSLVDIE